MIVGSITYVTEGEGRVIGDTGWGVIGAGMHCHDMEALIVLCERVLLHKLSCAMTSCTLNGNA